MMLCELDSWIARVDCFYARFQDDIILVSRRRHALKRMRKEMYQILSELRLGLRSEKTFMGRSQKGFDLLGHNINSHSFPLSQKNQEKALETTKCCYAQGGYKSLLERFNRWRVWVHLGSHFKIHYVENTIESITAQATIVKEHCNLQSTT